MAIVASVLRQLERTKRAVICLTTEIRRSRYEWIQPAGSPYHFTTRSAGKLLLLYIGASSLKHHGLNLSRSLAKMWLWISPALPSVAYGEPDFLLLACHFTYLGTPRHRRNCYSAST